RIVLTPYIDNLSNVDGVVDFHWLHSEIILNGAMEQYQWRCSPFTPMDKCVNP
ncbi:7230_t:CDS:1, partial [Dentiscutata heterogama]